MNKILSIVTLFGLMVPVTWGQDTVTDIDSNVYETVQIGEQLWMAENLKVTHYRNGDEIPTGYSNEEWANLSTGAYAVYPVDTDGASQATCGDNCAEVYGNLYNGYVVVDERGVCPEDWHVPSEDEWTILSDYLGGESVAGGKLKSTGTVLNGDGLWYSQNGGATNESGFTGHPGAARWGSGGYYLMGLYGYFWSSTENIVQFVVNIALHNDDSSNYSYSLSPKQHGYSVRCLKD